MTFKLFFKIIGASFLALFTAIVGIFSPVAEPNICMIAHRGYSSKYPENTELSFVMAGEHGSGGAETDVRVTKDGIYVTSHNAEITLKDGTVLSIADSDFSELTSQPLKNKKTRDTVYLCTFKRYLEIMKKYNMICFIELKGSFNDKQVVEIFNLAKDVYDLSKCILQSFDFDNLLRAHRYFPKLDVMLTYGTDDTDYEKCFEYGFSIDVDYKALTEEMVEQFHSRGLNVAVWTANNIFVLSYCRSMGVDFIESDVFGG